MSARVLLVGSGGREHAVAWKLSQSPQVGEIFVAPGNAGTAALARNLDIRPTDIDGLVRAAKEHRIDFYLATMDDPQPLGLVDRLQAEGVLCYGPSAAAARIEASKAWAKAFMERHGIPTARGRSFSSFEEAAAWVESLPEQRLWVKASGLAAGKGAVGAANREEAIGILRSMLIERAFGDAGSTVVVEEELSGFETSAHAFCDGRTAVLWPFATDYKRALDGAQGLNTGGMGAYAPTKGVDSGLAGVIKERVIDPVLRGMEEEGHPFVGTLFPGLMVRDGDVKVIEYNARSGDPETQVHMLRLESDLYAVARAAAEGRLAEVEVRWAAEPAVCVVLVPGGYPGKYETGHPIEGLDRVDPDVFVFHGGTKLVDGQVVTSGGRALTVAARAATVREAREKVYENVRRIHFKDMHYRTDIALEAAAGG
ncbi:MAG: phosphoribosylamine--glycine ligase [Tepidiforma sp.]|nr:phosphoribosylamine--glycine ligase [Tepidiforma sp.]GIW17726.1 MAG: phosphoribosylamine--glycine ligase [Tepidiforma sp.]